MLALPVSYTRRAVAGSLPQSQGTTLITRSARVMRSRIGRFFMWAAIATSLAGVAGQVARPPADAVAARVQVLEDRDAIRALLVSYASTLDGRDFAGFEQLWARDAEFVGGANDRAKGPAAIRDLLQGLLKVN